MKKKHPIVWKRGYNDAAQGYPPFTTECRTRELLLAYGAGYRAAQKKGIFA